MKEFVKIKGYPNWFLVLRTPNDVPPDLEEIARQRIGEIKIHEYFYGDKANATDLKYSLDIISNNSANYASRIEKNGAMLVRPIGSYMYFRGEEITETVFAKDFPLNEMSPEILICENSEQAEKPWVAYLKKRYPEKKIGVINFFSTRDVDFIHEQFQKCELITFSTSFSDYGWFEKLLGSLQITKKSLGIVQTQQDGKKPIK